MELVLLGIGTLVVVAALFWWSLPRGGTQHWFIDTQWEAYVAVAIVVGLALGVSITGSGLSRMSG